VALYSMHLAEEVFLHECRAISTMPHRLPNAQRN
jgi:hypothetical protein